MVEDLVQTRLGRLYVRRAGSGPAAVLWHSLFVDSRSWGPLFGELARHRTVVAIDGPCHGSSEPLTRDFSYDECTQAAAEALDELGIGEPVDWVGSSWGGHIGILLAATQPQRIRTLTTIGTPVQALSPRFRLTKAWPLVALYRLSGPSQFLCNELSDALLGPEAVAAQPDQAAITMDAFRQADRTGMYHAARSMMLKRPSVSDRLSRITAPTLMLAARGDDEGWPLHEAEAACASMPNARAVEVSGDARVAPLLLDAGLIARTLAGFWSTVDQQPGQHVQPLG